MADDGTERYFVGLNLDRDEDGRLMSDYGVAARVLGQIVADERTVKFRLVPEPTRVNFYPINSRSPGITINALADQGFIDVALLAPSNSYTPLPRGIMSDGRPGSLDAGLVTMHELGHAAYALGLIIPGDSNAAAVYVENAVRRSRSSSAATRTRHRP